MANNPGTWEADERVERLTALWQCGDSCTLIAQKISAEFRIHVTRNAVIGKVMRLGLDRRSRELIQANSREGSERGRRTQRKARAEPKPKAAAPQPRPGSLPPEPNPYLCEPVDEPAGGNSMGYTLTERPVGGCTWVLNAKRGGEWLFCGAKAEARMNDLGSRPGEYVLCDEHLYSTRNSPGMFNASPPASVRNMLKRLDRYQ